LSISGLKNTQFYKDEIFIPQNPKKKRKIKKIYKDEIFIPQNPKKRKIKKYLGFFTQALLAPWYPHNMQILSCINH
jgi:hypothetical protein